MRTLRQINIKSRPLYFFNDMTKIKNFDPSLLGIDKISLIHIMMLIFITSNMSQ